MAYGCGRTILGEPLTIPSLELSNNFNKTFNKYKTKFFSILDNLKESLKNLRKHLRIKKSNTQKYAQEYATILDNQRLNKEYVKYLHTIDIRPIFESMDKLRVMFKKDPLIEDEFFDFLEIQQITEYLLKNQDHINPNIKELNFIIKLFKDFKEIVFTKENLFGDISSQDQVTEEMLSKYEQKYASFEEEFSQDKEKFYLEMYTPSGKHQNTIDSLYAVMKE